MTLPTAVVTTDAALPAVTTKEAAVTPRAVPQIVVVETALVLVARRTVAAATALTMTTSDRGPS